MTPLAACAICGQRTADAAEGAYGDWVAFADHDNHALPDPGGPRRGLAYFCVGHLALARERAAWRCLDALDAIRAQGTVAAALSAPAPLAEAAEIPEAAEAAEAHQRPWWPRWWG